MNTNEILKRLRNKSGKSQIEMADIFNVSLSSYQKYERDKNSVMPSLEVLTRIADYYNVTIDYLVGRNTEETETIDKLVSEFNMTILEKKILEGYLELPENMRGDFMKFLENAVIETQEESKL